MHRTLERRPGACHCAADIIFLAGARPERLRTELSLASDIEAAHLLAEAGQIGHAGASRLRNCDCCACHQDRAAQRLFSSAVRTRLLLDIQRSRDVAYLVITHDISVARAFADRVAVMMKGELVEVGPSEQVLRTPAHAYTQRLVAAVPALG
jgi:hypothetical protein